MLQKGYSAVSPTSRPRAEDPPGGPDLELGRLFRILRRHWFVVAVSFTSSICLAVAFLALVTPRYQATAILMLDTRRLQPLQPLESVSRDESLDAAAVATQIQLLSSNAIATEVIQRLGLMRDPEFTAESTGLSTIIRSAFDRFGEMSATEPDQASSGELFVRALNRFQSGLFVERAAKSYALEISFESQDRDKAIQIANTVAEIYIQDQLRGRYAVSKQATEWLTARIEELRQQAVDADRAIGEFRMRNPTATREAQLELAVLEGRARTYRTLHDTFLRKAVESSQQLSAPSTEARLITDADLSTSSRTYPRTLSVLSLAGFLGFALGCGLAYTRERLNPVFRDRRDVEEALGVECIGVVTSVRRPLRGALRKGDAAPDPEKMLLSPNLGIGRHVVTAPLSRFAETIRSIKLAADTRLDANGARVIGLSSALPGEGKSILAANLAQLIAHGGRSVLLVDADLRKIPGGPRAVAGREQVMVSEDASTLTELIAPAATAGILEVLEGTADLGSVIWHDPVTRMDFLPSARSESIPNSNELLASERMASLISEAQQRYDYVILDFPPIGLVVDAKAAAHFVDGFLFVIEWARTPQRVVADVLQSSEGVAGKLIGTVLNKASASELKKTELIAEHHYDQYFGSANRRR